eukprot:7376952-Prymnesium_polylepis.1
MNRLPRRIARQPRRQVGQPRLAQCPRLQRDGNLTVDVGLPLPDIDWRHVHNLLELDRMTLTVGIKHAWKFMAQLQVQTLTHGLADVGRQRLRFQRPRLGIEADEHVVAIAQIAPRSNLDNLKETTRHAISMCLASRNARNSRPACPRDDSLPGIPETADPPAVRAAVRLDEGIQLASDLSRPRVVRAAVHSRRHVPLGQLEAHGALQVDVAPLRLGQQPLAHQHHRTILEVRDPRPLQRGLLEEGVADFRGCRRVDFLHPPLGGPFGQILLELPLLHPLVGHTVVDHRLREDAVYFGVWQQQCDLLVAHDCTGQLLHAIELLKIDRHGEDEDAAR